MVEDYDKILFYFWGNIADNCLILFIYFGPCNCQQNSSINDLVYTSMNVVALLHFPYNELAPYFSAAVKWEIVELRLWHCAVA